MITVIVHHWVCPEKLDMIKGRIQQAGKTMQSQPGFIHRQTLISAVDPLQVTTVTNWESNEAFQAFAKARDMPDLAESPWIKEPEISIFTALPELL
jgi:heme-degrading monooxygenase HmoA